MSLKTATKKMKSSVQVQTLNPIDQAASKPIEGRQEKRGKKILHFLSTQPTASPFDINMAVDSGYDIIVPHINVGLNQTRALVQDAIFSRPPNFGRYTGVFIGGKDTLLALDMLSEVDKALVPPFEVRAFADPGGSFTTAAAMVALVEQHYLRETKKHLNEAHVSVFGATGVVGFTSAVISALQGAHVTVVSHIGLDAIAPLVKEAKRRFNVELKPALGARDSDKVRILAKSDIALCAAAAGVRVIEAKHLKKAKPNIILADVNAVPPTGIEGVELFDNGKASTNIPGLTIGPLAIGDVKYKTQSALLKNMTASPSTVLYDFRDAFEEAKRIVARRGQKS